MAKAHGIIQGNVVVLKDAPPLEDGTEVIVLYPAEHPLAPYAGAISDEDAERMLQVIHSGRKTKRRIPKL